MRRVLRKAKRVIRAAVVAAQPRAPVPPPPDWPAPLGIAEDTERARALYLDLLVRAIINSIYRDPNIGPNAKPAHDEEARRVGYDWPATAHSMAGRLRLESLRDQVGTLLREGVAGDFIETGVWRGGACVLMRGVLAAHGVRDRKVHVADSFAGLPPPDATRYPADAGDSHHEWQELAISRAQVEDTFRSYGLLDEQVVFHEGWFKDTLHRIPTDRFALIRLDGDLYESTIQALEALYPRLSPGGFCVIDDYALAGCRKAVDDYRAREGIADPIETIDWTGVYWRKAPG